MHKAFTKNLIFVLSIAVLIFALTFPLLHDSLGRFLFIQLSLLLYIGIFLYTKDIIKSSLLYILFVLPFNITYQLPHSVEILSTEIQISNPYVMGIFVNYLVPTISILDIGVFVMLLAYVFQNGLRQFLSEIVEMKNGFLVFLFLLLIQTLYHFDFLVLFNSVRFSAYLLVFILMAKNPFLGKLKLTTIFYLFLINTLIQVTIGIMQFSQGASLSLDFLGESQVVSGMQGSSFVELGGQLFLRSYGTFPHPNVLAGYLILSFILGICIIKRDLLKGIVLATFSFMGIIFTLSRISICMCIIILLFMLLKKVLRREIFYLRSFFLFERFESLVLGLDRSFDERRKLFDAGLKVLRENWLLGTGIGRFTEAMELFVPRAKNNVLLLQPVHNIFLLLLSDLGVLGSLAYLYILIYLFIKRFRRVSLYSGILLFTVVVIGLFDHYFFSMPQGLVLFYVFLSLSIYFSESLDYGE